MTPSAFSVTLSSEEMQRIKDVQDNQAAEIKRLTEIIERACIDRISDPSAPKNVKYGVYDGSGNFIVPEALPNIPALEAASSIFESNSADISVFYETLYKIANYGSDMQFMREVAASCIEGMEKHSLIAKLTAHMNKHLHDSEINTPAAFACKRAKVDAIKLIIDEINGERTA
jgi:hypothetical protein